MHMPTLKPGAERHLLRERNSDADMHFRDRQIFLAATASRIGRYAGRDTPRPSSAASAYRKQQPPIGLRQMCTPSGACHNRVTRQAASRGQLVRWPRVEMDDDRQPAKKVDSRPDGTDCTTQRLGELLQKLQRTGKTNTPTIQTQMRFLVRISPPACYDQDSDARREG